MASGTFFEYLVASGSLSTAAVSKLFLTHTAASATVAHKLAIALGIEALNKVVFWVKVVVKLIDLVKWHKKDITNQTHIP